MARSCPRSTTSRSLTFLFGVVGLGLLAAIPAIAQSDLLVPSPENLRPSEKQAAFAAALERSPATQSMEWTYVDPDALLSGESVRVGPVLLKAGRVEPRPDGSFSWFSGTDTSEGAHFAVRDGSVFGEVWTQAARYSLRPLSGGLHALMRTDPSALPSEHPPEASGAISDPPRLSFPAPEALGGSTGEPIGVIVAYTPETAAAVADVPLLAQASIDQTNESYRNTGLDVRLELVHVYETSTSSSGSMATDRVRFLTPGDGYFDEIDALRYSEGGDLAVLLGHDAATYGTCGLAVVDADEFSAYAAVAHDCSTVSYTFAHEVGHLQGARHNPENDGTPTPYPYGHGTTDTANGFRTVMGYNRSGCPGGWCEKLLSWSSPNVEHAGAPTGDPSVRNNARVLDETAPTIAAFRTAGSPPALNASASVINIEVLQGRTQDISLTVSNPGDNRLFWDLNTDLDLVFPNTDQTYSTGEGSDGYTWKNSTDDPDLVEFEWLEPPPDVRYLDPRWGGLATFGITLHGCTYRQFSPSARGQIRFTRPFSQDNPPPLTTGVEPCDLSSSLYLNVLSESGLGPIGAPGEEVSTLRQWLTASGHLVIQWSDYTHSQHGGLYTFQAILREDGGVTYQYKTINMPIEGVQIGMHRLTNRLGGVQYWAYPVLPPSAVQDGVAVRIEPTLRWVYTEDRPEVLESRENQALALRVDARRLREGSFEGELVLSSILPSVRPVRIPVSLTVTVPPVSDEDSPERFATGLSPPFPNPTRAEVGTILHVVQLSNVSVTVLDMTGREVARLADGPLAAGSHPLVWDTSSAASGVYVIRLVTPEAVQTRRVVVAR